MIMDMEQKVLPQWLIGKDMWFLVRLWEVFTFVNPKNHGSTTGLFSIAIRSFSTQLLRCAVRGNLKDAHYGDIEPVSDAAYDSVVETLGESISAYRKVYGCFNALIKKDAKNQVFYERHVRRKAESHSDSRQYHMKLAVCGNRLFGAMGGVSMELEEKKDSVGEISGTRLFMHPEAKLKPIAVSSMSCAWDPEKGRHHLYAVMKENGAFTNSSMPRFLTLDVNNQTAGWQPLAVNKELYQSGCLGQRHHVPDMVYLKDSDQLCFALTSAAQPGKVLCIESPVLVESHEQVRHLRLKRITGLDGASAHFRAEGDIYLSAKDGNSLLVLAGPGRSNNHLLHCDINNAIDDDGPNPCRLIYQFPKPEAEGLIRYTGILSLL